MLPRKHHSLGEKHFSMRYSYVALYLVEISTQTFTLVGSITAQYLNDKRIHFIFCLDRFSKSVPRSKNTNAYQFRYRT